MFFIVLPLLALSIWGVMALVIRKARTGEPVIVILRDWRGRAASRVLALLAFGDRDVINRRAASDPAELRQKVDAKVAARPVPPPPSFTDDQPAQATQAEAAMVMNGPIPPHWKHAIEALSSVEPENYQEHLAIFAGEASGIVAYSEAWFSFAETQLHGIGIDPAAVQASMEAADSVGDCAHDFVLAGRRFLVIYQEIIEAVENGLDLPFQARQFFGRDAA
jgi:hypothetical protein